MKFVTHSPESLFTEALRDYCEEKLAKPILKLRLDSPATALNVEASQHGESVELKVRVSLPGSNPFTVQAANQDAYASIDLAADNLIRRLRDIEERRRALERRASMPIGASLDDEEHDLFTEGEEEALREMGALDAVLDR